MKEWEKKEKTKWFQGNHESSSRPVPTQCLKNGFSGKTVHRFIAKHDIIRAQCCGVITIPGGI